MRDNETLFLLGILLLNCAYLLHTTVAVQPKKIAAITTVLALTVITFLNLFCSNNQSNQPSVENNTYLNHNDTVKYVGMDQCRACHNNIYETFIETGMGQSFHMASKEKSAAKFSSHYVVKDPFKNLNYYSYWHGDSMYIMEFRLEGKDTVHKRIEKVDYIIGSGQHTNSHMMNVNGYVYQLPLTWYAQKGKWDLPPGYENGTNVRFNRTIGLECMSCHNAMPSMEKNSGNKFVNIPKGIDCERCHGPGELHVREKVAGNFVDTATQIDYTIVNPAKLSYDLQIDVCQRCHLQGNAVLKEGKDFTDFRPGKKLSDYIDIFMPKYKHAEDEFIMASHAQRLQMSKCFISAEAQPLTEQHAIKNKGALTCISCHNPHVSVTVTGRQVFNASCNKCHDKQQNNFCTEKESIQQAANFDCVTCHMPKSGTIDIPHVTVTDHWIRVPVSTSTKNKLKEFVGIYSINNPATTNDTKGKAYISYFEKFEGEVASLDSAKKYLMMTEAVNQNVDALIHLWYVSKSYDKIVQQASKLQISQQQNPWLCYRVGYAYMKNESFNIAEGWYKKALELAPENLDFINALGALYAKFDQDEKAVKILDLSLQKNPKQSEPLTNLGYIKAKAGRYEEALRYYNMALALDPDFEQALLNKAAVLNITNKKAESVKLLKQILKNNPNNEQVKNLLNSL